ncbi:putative pentatricopeptide repeat-containing protein At5g40405 [Chenopodium quinoa]|uniref:putative pentatricopeptide repeat-containing protein At5g40405 n=1 Tax=Chenopodium quinoa TaxID=63459 RepID=UPI000B79509A|nr:putative pentatricopeptide repeat-containing protein At5g40405 [Chenopodium quinoa]
MTLTNHLKSSKFILSLLDNHQCLTIPHLNQIQSHLIASGALSDTYAVGKLVSAFANHPTYLSHAYKLLISSRYRSNYMWNSLIKFFVDNHEPIKAISLYKNMISSGSFPNNYTFSFVIKATNDLCDLPLGIMLHAQSIKLGWEFYDFVQNGLIHLYAMCNAVDSSRKLFDVSAIKDVVTWTAVINGYVKVGRIGDARKMFDEMPERNVVSWSAMITGYAQMGFFEEALEVFNDMQMNGFRPNHSSLVGALTACAALGAFDQGKWIHAYVDRNRMELDVKLGTALVDMYSKCGCIEMANRVFEDMPSKDVFAFTSLISALSNHGQCERAIELFNRMQREGVNPNGVTFICVLAACSRMGLVDKGLQIFESMKHRYGIEPGVEHYGCLIDLLARSGMLQEAAQLVRKMSVKPDSYVLGALLNACREYDNVELGEEIVKQLMEQGLDYSGVHTLLSNIYALAKKWDGVMRVREQMQEKMVRKVPGCSLIEVDGVVSEFGAGHRYHKKMEDVMLSLLQMDKHLRSFLLDHNIALGSCT